MGSFSKNRPANRSKLAEILYQRGSAQRESARRAAALHKGLHYLAAAKRDAKQPAMQLHVVNPLVLAATAEELIAAGWGSYERHRIPGDWRERRPVHTNAW